MPSFAWRFDAALRAYLAETPEGRDLGLMLVKIDGQWWCDDAEADEHRGPYPTFDEGNKAESPLATARATETTQKDSAATGR